MQSKDLKTKNRLDVLHLISKGTRSRAEISATLGISKPAVSALVDGLVSEGLVVESGRGRSPAGGGRRPILLELNPQAGLIVAVYLNELWYEVAVVDLSMKVLSHTKKETNSVENYRQTLDDITTAIRRSVEEVRGDDIQQRILACGIAFKGLVDTRTGRTLYSATMPRWEDVPVRDYMTRTLGYPVYLENDARAITYAELLYGEGGDVSTLACVSGSWGLGTGVVIQHEVYRGAFDVAVTFAHTTVADNGPLCSCGNRGCWEALASTQAFLRELTRRRPDLEGIGFPEAVDLFHDGDSTVREVMLDYTGYWLGVGVANMLNVFNPEKLVVQGAITSAGEALRLKIEEVAREKALPIPRTAEITFSTLTDRVEVKGAAAVVVKRFFSENDHRALWNRTDPVEHASS